MRNRISTLALAAALTLGASGIALAQGCPPGYAFDGAYCQPAPTPGGIVGGAANAAGNIVGGAVGAAGAIAGGAVNAAGNIVGGTVGAVTGQPPYPPPPPAYGSTYPSGSTVTCPPGYVLNSGACYQVR